ncbi:HGWP repeat containing protein-like [Oryza sativa Japonica Group]|uniref:HGWP repeat containing protein-like n=2 Tax=Oryza sativa subsp. japonica TaxID=39947 RepID=Q5JJW9_ORYSJ|nr:HGWP repeat containing protein-like [Oryza sativa Japonica Group]
MKRIAESKLNIKKVNLRCLFVGAIPSYEPSDMIEDSLQSGDLYEVDSEDMNHEKFWNGSIIELPQPSLSQPKGAPWSKSGEEKIPSATGGQAKQFRVVKFCWKFVKTQRKKSDKKRRPPNLSSC